MLLMQVVTMSEGTKRVVIAHLIVDGDSMSMPRRVVRQLRMIHAAAQVEAGSDPQFDGYWSCEYGWTSLDLASRYRLWETTSIDLPESVGNDARWVMQAS